jgi:renalase
MRIAVIGAGLSGLACADALNRQGHATTVFDKSRGVGGRLATRRLDGPPASNHAPSNHVAFDHGAQYMTARDPAFLARIHAWQAEGLVAPWPAAGDDAWVGTPTMNAPARALADRLDVRRGHPITALAPALAPVLAPALARGTDCWRLLVAGQDPAGPFDAALLAIPAEQAVTLLRPVSPAFADRAASTRSKPCWTLMAAFAERLPIDTDFLQRRPPIASAARNSAKPGRTGLEAWVIHADPDWSAAHLERTPDQAADALLDAFAHAAGIALPTPLIRSAHRWRYAKSGTADSAGCWDPTLRLGICGDWLLGPRVENAYLSGLALASAIGPA